MGVKKKDMTTFTRLKYLKQGRKRMTLYKWYKSVGRNSGKFVCFFLLQFFNTCDDPGSFIHAQLLYTMGLCVTKS